MTCVLVHDADQRRYLWVDRDEIDGFWTEASDLLFEALEYGDGKYSLDDLKKKCQEGLAVLWIGLQGNHITLAGVSWISQYPRDKRLILAFCGAEKLKYCYELFPVVEEYARECGCSAMEIYGRRGWVGRLDGFEEIHTVSRKSLWPAETKGRK